MKSTFSKEQFKQQFIEQLVKHWYMPRLAIVLYPLLPFSFVFYLVSSLRKYAYKIGLFKCTKLPVPVVVVGNLTVGGTGKTPLILAFAQYLKANGWQPGIISRGYQGSNKAEVSEVLPEAEASVVGDEPLLLAQKSLCPVYVARNRVAAAKALLAAHEVNIILSDDGLQHYALARDLEIAVITAGRGYGNAHLLPAGPLREPMARLASVDFCITQANESRVPGFNFRLEAERLRALQTGESIDLTKLKGRVVHAVAGIAEPERFFLTLKQLGAEVIPHAFPDHHAFTKEDISFADGHWIVMTGKDAVKCVDFASGCDYALEVNAACDASFWEGIKAKLARLQPVRAQDTVECKVESAACNVEPNET